MPMRQIENKKPQQHGRTATEQKMKVQSRKAILSVQINWLEFILADEWVQNALYTRH